MADKIPNNSPAASGFTRFLPVALLGLIVAACGGNAPPPPAPAKPAAPAATAAAPAAGASVAAAAPAPEMTVDQLLKAANTAFGEKRYVTPQGNNALEYYLQVLAKDPKNNIAESALREMFPFATGEVEQEINGGSLDEASRVIDELAKFDPSNYTLTILRGKLDAKKKQAEHDQQVATAAATAAAAKAAADQKAAAQAAAAPAPEPAAAAPPKPAPPPVEKPVAPPPVAAAPAPVTTPAQLLKSVAPSYPPEAFRSRRQGWVEVQFTITTDGKVSNAKVTNAEPSRVFDQAALEAVRRWTFKPRMVNGKPVEEEATRRIEFKLGG
ncbi:MAG: energy transducer TonB [Xanthomonadaceae bacterium]|nr:energy transducer TonB [Xanthomonadaceae bacterium]